MVQWLAASIQQSTLSSQTLVGTTLTTYSAAAPFITVFQSKVKAVLASARKKETEVVVKVLENLGKACFIKKLDDVAALVVAAKGVHGEVVQTAIKAMLEVLPIQKVGHNLPDGNVVGTGHGFCCCMHLYDKTIVLVKMCPIHAIITAYIYASTAYNTNHTSALNISYVGKATICLGLPAEPAHRVHKGKWLLMPHGC